MENCGPLGSVVLLHDVSHTLTGQEEVSWVVELEVHRVCIQHVEVFLKEHRDVSLTIYNHYLQNVNLQLASIYGSVLTSFRDSKKGAQEVIIPFGYSQF